MVFESCQRETQPDTADPAHCTVYRLLPQLADDPFDVLNLAPPIRLVLIAIHCLNVKNRRIRALDRAARSDGVILRRALK